MKSKTIAFLLFSIIFYALFLSCSVTRHSAPPKKEIDTDTDNDGITDKNDKCPNQEGTTKYEGCPVPDSDGDGTNDDIDKCPYEKGSPKYEGCPMPDRDGDGISDEMDECPDEAGQEYNKGCPVLAGSPSPVTKPEDVISYMPSINHHRPAGTDKIKSTSTILPQASFAYSYRNKIPIDNSILVHVIVQLNSPLPEVENVLRKILDEKPATLKSLDDSSIIKSKAITADKYFYVKLDCDKNYFTIDSLTTGIQELNTRGKTEWIWRVHGIKLTNQSQISLVIHSIDKEGKMHDVDNGVIYMQVTVDPLKVIPATSSENAAQPTSFFLRFKWLLLIAGLIFITMLVWIIRKRLTKSKSRIYFSYAWNNGEPIIDKLYTSLKTDGFNVIRDKANLKYKGAISTFMTDIGKGNFVIVIISDKYLKSKFCMFELYEIYRNSGMNKAEFMKKIFPVRLDEIDLSNPIVVNSYIDFWELEELKSGTLLKENSETATAEQASQYQAIKRIVTDLGDILYFLSDINALNIEQLSKDNFAEIKSAIRAAIEAEN